VNVSDGVERPVCEPEDDCDDDDLRPVRESQMDILRVLCHRHSNKECVADLDSLAMMLLA
jgi:hypothetical protein